MMEDGRGRYFVKTLGCKANLYDSQLIESELQRRGWQPAETEDHPDVKLVVVNSCTVTDEADRQSRKAAQRALRHSPKARVVMTGCSAEAHPESLKSVKGVHYIVGNRDKPRLVQEVLSALEKGKNTRPSEALILGSAMGYPELLSRHPVDREWPLPEELFEPLGQLNNGRTRSFLKVQEGCNSFCTFCIIPYGRGPSRSLPLQPVISRVRALVDQGAQEITLTGTNLGDYGVDWAGNPQIEILCESILTQTSLPRLRLTSLDPTEISESLLALIEAHSPRFCAHLHVSLQSPHSKILRLMKRRYSSSDVERCLRAIETLAQALDKSVFVGMDVITGFPGESDSDFIQTVALLRDLPWSRLHVFPYSERTGTPATRLGQSVPLSVRKERARELMELSLLKLKSHYQASQRAVLGPVLFEGVVRGPTQDNLWVSGYTDHYLRCLVPVRDQAQALRLKNVWHAVTPQSVWVDEAHSDVSYTGQLDTGR